MDQDLLLLTNTALSSVVSTVTRAFTERSAVSGSVTHLGGMHRKFRTL